MTERAGPREGVSKDTEPTIAALELQFRTAMDAAMANAREAKRLALQIVAMRKAAKK